jgi:pantoate--beta-alanine ligase
MITELKQQATMQRASSPDEMKKISNSFHGTSVGFVPTMGCLHEGHMSLIKKSLSTCNYTVVSIFVNPIQFGPNEDLDIYPRDLEGDIKKLESAGVDVLFQPQRETIYPKEFKTYVQVDEITDQLCGKSRPELFKGVITVVLKLFNIVRPQHVFFGEKDWQQLAVIETMVRDLNLDIAVHRVPLVRDSDGLAMSSRNRNLSFEERQKALSLSKALEDAKKNIRQGTKATNQLKQNIKDRITAESGTQIDYISICDPITLQEREEVNGRTLIALAVTIGSSRLIDNCIIED